MPLHEPDKTRWQNAELKVVVDISLPRYWDTTASRRGGLSYTGYIMYASTRIDRWKRQARKISFLRARTETARAQCTIHSAISEPSLLRRSLTFAQRISHRSAHNYQQMQNASYTCVLRNTTVRDAIQPPIHSAGTEVRVGRRRVTKLSRAWMRILVLAINYHRRLLRAGSTRPYSEFEGQTVQGARAFVYPREYIMESD